MNAIECIKSRASVRSFKADPVPEKYIEDIIDSATHAPSAGNVQDWEFIVVSDQEVKEKLVEAAWGQDFISSAPVVIVVCSDTKRIRNAYGDRGTSLFSIQDIAAATQNLILSAWDKGIGSCWVGSFNEQSVTEALVLPNHVRPMVILPVGYPGSSPAQTKRRSVREVIHKDYY